MGRRRGKCHLTLGRTSGPSHLHEGLPKILFQPPGQPLRHVGNLVGPPPPGDGALPHHRHSPALRQQLLHRLPIPPPVAFQLAPPEFCVGAGQPELGAATVGVPEAAVHKDDCPVAGQHNVGTASQAAVVLAETEAVAVELGANLPLRSVLCTADAGHGVMALFRGHGVHSGRYSIPHFFLQEKAINPANCRNFKNMALWGHEHLVANRHCPWHLSGGRSSFLHTALYPSRKHHRNDTDFHPAIGAGNEDRPHPSKSPVFKAEHGIFLSSFQCQHHSAHRAAERNIDSPTGYQHGFYHSYLFGHSLCSKSHYETDPKEKIHSTSSVPRR